jgi:hypothetical protein
MKSPLLQKQALDAFLEALNNPEVATNDPRADKQFEHPYGSKGTEEETVKQGADFNPNDPNVFNQILKYLKERRTATTKDIAQALCISHEQAYGALQGLRDTGMLGYHQMRWNIKLGATPAPALVSPRLKMWDLVQQAGGPLRVKNQNKTPEEAVQYLSSVQEAHLEKLRTKFPGVIPVQPEEIHDWVAQTYGVKQGATWSLVNDILHPHQVEPPPPPKPRDMSNTCPSCGGGLTRTYTEGGKATEMICTRCKFAPKQAATKPKCPHCGSTNYSLMPTDFETAKCNDCDKNWDHGIIEGINDPKTAAGWKSVLPVALSLGLGAPSATPSSTPIRPAIVEQQRQPVVYSPHMERLVNAIGRAEGAKPERHNPGNLTDINGKIRTYETDEEGKAALVEQLNRIADGLNPHFDDPNMSLADAGLVYSNGDENWSKNVSQILRVSEDIPFRHLIKPLPAKHHPKHAAKNAPDPGQYDEKHEEHVREEMKQWAQYAEEEDNTEDIKPFDPEGNYLCGDCDMRQGTNECMRVQGPISFEKGSCRLFHEGAPENQLPMEKKFTQAEAKYGESNQGGFGCHRCEYGNKAKEADGAGRPSWCSFWGTHVKPMACCAEQELVQIQPKAARKSMHDDSGATTGLRSRPDYGESDSYTSKMNEENKTAAAKIKWRVDPPATGPYSSFERRQWPSADYANGDIAAQIRCKDEYVPRQVKTGEHAPLTVLVADWNIAPEDRAKKGAFVWRKMKGEFKTLKEAQAAFAKVVEHHPEIHPENKVSSMKNPLLKRAGWTMTCPYCKGTARRKDREGDYKCDSCPWTSREEPKAMAHHADVEMHQSPTHLPPRDDMKRHLDEDVQQEIDDGVNRPVHEGVKLGDDDSEYERGLELQEEHFMDQVHDTQREARDAFMADEYLQQIARESGLTMDELWQEEGNDYANEYWQGRQASKKAVKTEEGTKACPKCTSSKVEEVTDNETEGGADAVRLFECQACAHLFSL